MILLQILAGFLIVPLTVLLLIVFNVYLMNWLYLLGVTLFTLIYSYLYGVISLDMNVGTRLFAVLAILYFVRMVIMARQYHVATRDNTYPALRGKIRIKQFKSRSTFFLPLSILKLCKLLPKAASREFTRKTGIEMELAKFIELLLGYSIGTRIEVVSEDADIYLEIK